MTRSLYRAVLVAGLAAAALAWAPGLPSAAPAARVFDAEGTTSSHILVVTSKGGLLGRFGHAHAVLARRWRIAFRYDAADIRGAGVEAVIEPMFLSIDSPEALALAGLARAPREASLRKIRERMRGPELLDIEKHPELRFVSDEVSDLGDAPGGARRLGVRGRFSLRGKENPESFTALLRPQPDGTVRVSGAFTFLQSRYGIRPATAAGGLIKVGDAIDLRFDILVPPR